MSSKLPSHAQVVIVGGGIAGCSAAYHLCGLGTEDVVLLEKGKLTGGSTWHAAGLVGQLRGQASITQLLGHSIDLYNRLESETGQATGWKMNGGLRLACNRDRMTEIQRQATSAHSFGLEMHILSPQEALSLWPLMDISDVRGAAFLPTDGQANPSDIAQALAKGARSRGATIIENCSVQDVVVENGRVTRLQTRLGEIACETILNCCGQWAREFGAMAGVNVPLVSVQHQYLITQAIEGVGSTLPTLRDPDRLTYYKEEVGGLVMGGYENNPIPWALDGFPENFSFSLLDSDWQHFEPLMELALPRVPSLQNAGIKQLINGPESFTPDGNFILGQAPELEGYYVAAGFNAFGIAAGGGAGKAIAQWIVAGEAPYDLWTVDIRRFSDVHRAQTWILPRTLELYGKHYTIAWPSEEHQSARGTKRSPLYERLLKSGACFGEKLGWERPNWFAPRGVPAMDHYSFERPNWFEHVGREHRSGRQRAVVIDQSSFAKFEVSGPDACSALNYICGANVDRPPGTVRYTQMMDSRGGIQCDLTVARLGQNRFYIVTGTGFVTHDFDWIKSNLPRGARVDISDITETMSVLSLMGPRSRRILESITDDDCSDQGIPFSTVRPVQIAGVNVNAIRITYVGELGYELHIPSGSATRVYDAVMSAGEPLGISNAGYRAIESLRLEKGYRAWGSDLNPDHTPLEAGLEFALKIKSGIDFIGRNAIVQQLARPLTKRLMCFSTDPTGSVLLGRETIYRDNQRVGWITSAGFGYTVNRNIGLGYVRDGDGVSDQWLDAGDYELEVASNRIPALIHKHPLYDPQGKRLRG